jgi:predicted deacylase
MEPLARFLGSEAILLAKNSGSGPFDECLSGVWWQLAQALAADGRNVNLPQGCCSTTIELRGEMQVDHALAQGDAQAIFGYLQPAHVLDDNGAPLLPASKCSPTPLAGSETLYAPAAGVVVFAMPVGRIVQKGDLIVEIIDPIANQTHCVLAGVDGTFYARIRDRYVTTGCRLGKIAGATPFRTGDLLGA